MKIGVYAHWRANWDGQRLWTMGCHAAYLRHYLRLTEGVRLFTTVSPVHREPNTECIEDPRLEVVVVPGRSFRTTWLKLRSLKRTVAANLDGLDAIHVRLFDPGAWLLPPMCQPRGIGLVFEIIGDPVNGFWKHPNWTLPGKLFRRLAFLPEEYLVFRRIRPHTLLINGPDCTRVYGPRHPNPIKIYSSAIDHADFFLRDDTCHEDRCVILYAGMIRADKRLETLIDALKILRADNRPAHLRLVGGGEPQDYVEHLKRYAEKQGVRDRMEFRGFVPDLLSEYRAADIYAFPSLHEGAARTLLEATSQSLPCVITEVGSARDLFTNEQTALIVPVNNPETMAAALCRFMDEPELRRRCIHNAYALAAEHTCEKFIRQMMDRLEHAHREAARKLQERE